MAVYFARVGRYIKVGYSENPERRVRRMLSSATRYGAPLDCDIYDRELLATIPGDLNAERACHAALEDYAAGCEFFIDEPGVREFIELAQRGEFPQIVRPGGWFVPPSRVTAEDREHLHSVLNRLFGAAS